GPRRSPRSLGSRCPPCAAARSRSCWRQSSPTPPPVVSWRAAARREARRELDELSACPGHLPPCGGAPAPDPIRGRLARRACEPGGGGRGARNRQKTPPPPPPHHG